MDWRLCTVALLLAAPASQAAPSWLVPSGIPYQVSQPSATGRSGSASIEARILLSKDGSSLLEVTTGTLDDESPAPGELSKVQLKGFTANGNPAFVNNYNHLSAPTFSASFTALTHLQPFQVQANVRGIDGHRTDVVTVQDVVRERPDVQVVDLSAPAKAAVNSPVNVSAEVIEANGEVGARADCVLEVDGAVADEAPGIWVDAGGSVSCAFTHVFTDSGTHQITVRAANVVPGDWDDSNNAATTQIEIVDPTIPLSYWAIAQDISTDYESYSIGWYRNANTGLDGEDWNEHTGYVQRSESGTISASGHVEVHFPLQLAEFSQQTNGSAVDARQYSNVQPTASYGNETQHSNIWTNSDPSDGVFIQVSSTGGTTGVPYTTVYYNRFAGDVVYFSYGQITYWYSDGTSSGYAYNRVGPEARSGGGFATMGSDYLFHVKLVGADGVAVGADADVALAPQSASYTSPQSCRDYSNTSGYSTHYCTGYDWTRSGVYGVTQSQ